MNDVLSELQAFDQDCQDVMAEVSALDGTTLKMLIDAFAGSGNVYILRGLSFRLAASDSDPEVHLLAFDLAERLKTQDFNVLSHLLTAVTRLEQKGVDWRTEERLATVASLILRCQSVGEMLAEDAHDFERQVLAL